MEKPALILARTQPLHVVYGGAHLFKAGTCEKLGELARRAVADYDLPTALELPSEIASLVFQKLEREPIEDFRIDFEDGFGVRSDDEEDTTAANVARDSVRGTLPRQFGIRIKPGERGLRTLRLFLENCSTLPKHFVVTLPKVTSAWEITALVSALKHHRDIGIEIMVETPQAIFQLPQLIEVGEGHIVAAHFGAYDYLASLGIAAQDLSHPTCDFARHMMQTALAASGVWLADGATNLLPLMKTHDRALVHSAWKMHYDNVRRSHYHGFYQSWDLHPAQIPARLAAVFTFFKEGLTQAEERLRSFVAATAKASEVKGMFDDAATARGLVNYFRRAHACGLSPDTVPVLAQLEKLLKIDARNH
jgi:citrate lyase beta subunit